MSIDSTAASWTSAQLLDAVRRKGKLPSTSLEYTDAVLLSEASDVIWSLAGWALEQAGGGRLSFSFDRSVVAALSSPYRAASEFLLPPHAVADNVHNVCWVDSSGRREHRLELIDVSSQSVYDSADSYGSPTHYSLLDGRVRVYPQPTDGGVLRFNYQRRHPALCTDTTTNAPIVTAVADAGEGYSAFSISSTTPFQVGHYCDLINPFYPYRTIFADLYVGATAGTTVTLYVPYSYVQNLPVSQMRLVRTGQSPFVSLPLELRTCVHEKIASNVMRNAGDMQSAGASEAISRDEMLRFLGLAAPRSKGDRKKIINPFSHLRGGGRRGRWPRETW